MSEDTIIRVCPKCGKRYNDTPALSREDGETLICSECGTREALESAGLDNADQEQILNAIERSGQNC